MSFDLEPGAASPDPGGAEADDREYEDESQPGFVDAEHEEELDEEDEEDEDEDEQKQQDGDGDGDGDEGGDYDEDFDADDANAALQAILLRSENLPERQRPQGGPLHVTPIDAESGKDESGSRGGSQSDMSRQLSSGSSGKGAYRVLKEELVGMLRGMGFVEVHCRHAVEHVADPTAANVVDECIEWMMSNPLSEEMMRESLERLVQALSGMGFTEAQARAALVENEYDMQRSIEFLVSEISRKAESESKRIERQSSLLREAEMKKVAELKRQREEALENEHAQKCIQNTPSEVRFGHLVALRSRMARFMISREDHPALDSDAERITDECVFRLVDPTALSVPLPGQVEEKGEPIRGGALIAMVCSDGCYVGTEANGQVYSNRREIGAFVKWHVYDADDRRSTEVLTYENELVFQSALHNWLVPSEDGQCSAQRQAFEENAIWQVLFRLPLNIRPATPSFSHMRHISKSGPRTGLELWEDLRETFRLRTMVMLREKIQEFQDEVERETKLLERKKVEEFTCIICWEEEPCTVLLECGHIVVCKECGDGLVGRTCPICRAPVTRVVEMIRDSLL